MTLSVGDRLGRYEILGPLGVGGMGEVYRARDTELERDVAVKVLPEAVAQNPDRLERFEREAKAVAKLSHPNILEIHDFGREGEITYSVTELLEGETLRERVPPEGIGWQRAAAIGAAVAEGLAAAHSRGVVHRDLKPENVFITTDGRVKILDFGLARLQQEVFPEAETGTLTPAGTEVGTIMGTVGYMAPEQAKGRPADARSDIFALGCVLYEMLSGRRAFARDTTAETIAAILKEDPPVLSDAGVAVPAEFERTVRRCLEKSPEARFQSASDLAYDLKSISTDAAVRVTTPTAVEPRRERSTMTRVLASAGVLAVVAAIVAVVWLQRRGETTTEVAPGPELDRGRIAVAAFDNRTGDPSLDTLGVLAADLIVQRFTETAAAEVVPLANVVHGAPPTGRDDEQGRGWSDVLGRVRELGAGLVLSGATYLDGEALRLQARVFDAATGDLIYAFEPVEVGREAAAEGIDTLRERVVAAVAAHLNSEVDIAVMRPPSTYDAFQIFQRGMESFGRDWREALAYLQRALELDPDFHFARFHAAWAYLNLLDDDGMARELSALEERLDHMTPYEKAHVRYQRSVCEWDRSASVSALRRMLELCPEAQSWRVDLAMRELELNRPMAAEDTLAPLQQLDFRDLEAISWWQSTLMAAAHHMLGDYQRELEYAELGLERFPGVAPLFHAKARALAALGRTVAVNKVIDEFLRTQTRGGSAGWLMSATALEVRAHGYREAADEMAVRAVTWYEDHPAVLMKESGSRIIELWVMGYTEEKKSFANALWMVERWDDLEDLIVQLIQTEPSQHQLAGWLGVVAAIRGDRPEARQISDGLPASGSARARAWRTYWQASIAAHLGEKDRAVDLLAEAFSKGYPYVVSLHSSMEFEPLWDYPPFQELIKPKG